MDISEQMVIGRDETELSEHRYRALALRACAVGAVVVTTVLQPESLQDKPLAHPATPEASLFDTTVAWPFEPHHQEILFTSMGATIVKRNTNKLLPTAPANVSFNGLHCKDKQVYGDVSVWKQPSTLYHFSDVMLPENSLSFDCFWDNRLDNTVTRRLTIGKNAYQYVVNR